jgi:quercetin dioxygenase-like cupin family protein
MEHSLEGFSYQITHVTLQSQNKRPKVTTDAFEFMYILEGEIDYYLDNKLQKLNKGDSLFFDGRIPHVPLNHTEQIASYIVIYFFHN